MKGYPGIPNIFWMSMEVRNQEGHEGMVGVSILTCKTSETGQFQCYQFSSFGSGLNLTHH